MKRLCCLLYIVTAVFFTIHVRAQGVTIHSDPRLLLLKKKEPEVKRSSPERGRLIARASVPMASNASFSHAMAPAIAAKTNGPMPPANPVAEAAHPAATPTIAKPTVSPVPRYSMERLTSLEKTRVLYSGKGFRVQIYNGNDRNKAVETKMEFARRYPAVRTYLCYISPSFRVKVGDFRNRSDAEGMYREAKSMYSPCMIVPDIITVCTY
jgi:hypothetical protein